MHKPPNIYLDTNIIIHLIEGHFAYVDALRELARRIDQADVVAYTSELSLLEVLVKPMKDADTQRIDRFQDLFRYGQGLFTLPITRATLIDAATIRAADGTSLPDAIHVATALAAKCRAFLSEDTGIKLPTVCPRLGLDRISSLMQEVGT